MSGFSVTTCLATLGLVAALAWSHYSINNRIEAYQLTPADQQVMIKCVRHMSRNNLKFMHGASNADGCACVAKFTTACVHSYTIGQFGLELNAVLDEQSRSNKWVSKKSSSYDFGQETWSMRTLSLRGRAYQTVIICGDKDNHTPYGVSQIAALTPRYPAAAKDPNKPTLLRPRR